MKKISIISITFFLVVVMVMAFYLNGKTVTTPTTTTVNVTAVGCNSDVCPNLHWCLSNGTSGNPGSCSFSIQVPEGTFYLCVMCDVPNSDQAGEIEIVSLGGTQNVTVTMGENKHCNCDIKK